jgi:hypothetical protein
MFNLVEEMAVTVELTGSDWTKGAVKAVAHELAAYPEQDVVTALKRCRAEIKHKLTLADILDRMPSQHPGVEEAWGQVSKVMGNEQISLVWTDEMREAYGAAAPLADDRVAARMAFKEVYTKLVSEARAHRKMPTWSVSLGYDRALREECVCEAAGRNLISQRQAAALLAHDPPTAEARQLLLVSGVHA